MDKQTAYIDLIRRSYTTLSVREAELRTDGGQFNDILIVNGDLIFRFPKLPGTAREMETEIAILNAVRGRLPLPIPEPIYLGRDPGTNELLFMGYTLIHGVPLWSATLDAAESATQHRVATQLATFLRALHAVPVAELGLDLQLRDGTAAWSELYAAFRDELFVFMRMDARDAISREFEQFLGEPRNFDWRPALRHGDFGGSNILYDPNLRAVSGVIDFGAAALGDPAVDLAAVSGYGEAFMRVFLLAYPEIANENTSRRVAFYRSTYALQQALWARRSRNREDFEDGIAAYI